MHILLIHQAFAALDEPGGTRHHELARFLASKGHQVTVIASPVSYLTGEKASPPPSGSSHFSQKWGESKSEANMGGEQERGVRVIRAYTYNALHKSFVHRVFAFISFMVSSFFAGLGVQNVDVVWGTSPPIFQGWTAWMLARLKGAKFLFEVRDLWPDFAIAVGVLKNPVLINMSLWLERFLYKRADQVIVNSPGYVEHVSSRGAQRVELIPNGADPGMFNPLDMGSQFRASNHLQNRFVVLYAGAHGISNDLEVVLESARLLARRLDIHFVLLGDGKEKANLQARARELGVRNVTFLPPVAKSAMGAALAGADACLAILKPLEAYKTTYPNKVFDYMAAGRPVILAIDGVIRQVVEAANCGVFCEPGNAQALAEAVLELAADRDAALRKGLAGRAYLEQHFSRQVLAEKLEMVFNNLVQQK
jgi:glycosyltransferase involved in cell wall biosynthesis